MESIGSRIDYELDPRKPILYVLPIENILGKLALVPVGDTETIPYNMPRPCHEAHTPTKNREVEMAARCGMLIRGQWDGPVTSEYYD